VGRSQGHRRFELPGEAIEYTPTAVIALPGWVAIAVRRVAAARTAGGFVVIEHRFDIGSSGA
jgi:hypothetical protein